MDGYKPFGVPMRELESVVMSMEEYEALRLADYENLTHEKAAEKMNISRPLSPGYMTKHERSGKSLRGR
jgi:predicted DNA-binding protein (UPF0251 family)